MNCHRLAGSCAVAIRARGSSDVHPSGCQQRKAAEAGHEEIVAAPGVDKTGHVEADERPASGGLIARNDHLSSRSGDRVGVIALLEVVAETDPLLLHEFELIEPRVQRDEE